MRVAIEKIEYALPENAEDGSRLRADNPDWRIVDIQQKTGIATRYVASAEQTAADLAVQAADKLFATGVARTEIGAVIFVTQSPDYTLPTTACVLQDRLQLPTSSIAFDLNLGCSGFVYGLSVAGALIESGVRDKVLLLCGDTYSKYIEKSDRTCRPVFGDGAAATLLSRSAKGLLGPFELGTDGSGYKNLIVPNSGARVSPGQPRTIFMDGAKVFMFTMAKVPLAVNTLLDTAKLTIADIDLFVFHQASLLVLENIVRRLKLPQDKVYMNLQRVGNTVSASIPIALKDAASEGRLKPGARVMVVGFGVGYSWGACLLNWEGEI